jgi:hypothetical protein
MAFLFVHEFLLSLYNKLIVRFEEHSIININNSYDEFSICLVDKETSIRGQAFKA